MGRVPRIALTAGLGLAAGCALRGDVRNVQLQVSALQSQLAASDSARRAEHDSVLAAVAALEHALAAQQAYLVQLRGDLRTEVLNVEQQLVTVQELTGQSQQRLTELRAQLEQREAQPTPAPDTTAGAAAAPPAGGVPGPDQLFELSLQQLRNSRYATARSGFRMFLQQYPQNERAPDALFYVGESFAQDAPDSAAAVYEQVVKSFPSSPHAPTALYKLGLLAERRGDKAAARTYYRRVVAGYPRSDEAALARDRLQRLGR